MIEAPDFSLNEISENIEDRLWEKVPKSLLPDTESDDLDHYSVGTLEYFAKLPYENGGIRFYKPYEQFEYTMEAIEETTYFICNDVALTIWEQLEDCYNNPSTVDQYIPVTTTRNYLEEETFKKYFKGLQNMQVSREYVPYIIQDGKELGINCILDELTSQNSIPLRRYPWKEAFEVMHLKYDSDASEWYGRIETNIPGVVVESVYKGDSEIPELFLVVKSV